jgi:6-phosphogluconolactonase
MILAQRIWVLGLFVVLGCAGAPAHRDAAIAGAAASADAAAAGRVFVYVGMAGGELTLFHLDPSTGILARRGTVSGGRAPSSLAHSVERESLIAVDGNSGQAAAFSVNTKSGALKLVARTATGGAHPSGASLDDTGKYVLAAHPATGRVSVLAITESGGLNPIGTFAAGAGAHAVAVHTSQIAFVSNFRAGTVSQYTFNTGTGMLTPKAGPALALPTGSAPTRMVCHPSGRWVYLLDEGTDSLAVYGFDGDLKALSPISSQVITTLTEGAARGRSPAGRPGRPADIAVSPTGRFLYVTNRGPDGVAAFAIDGAGTLKLVGHAPSGGRAPGAVSVDPTGKFLIVANEGSKSLSVSSIDPTTGELGSAHVVMLPAPPISVLAVKW